MRGPGCCGGKAASDRKLVNENAILQSNVFQI